MLDTTNLTFGYYTVGDTVHTGKISALIDGTAKNIHPEWKFNNHVFDNVDWTVEPSESLPLLYLRRAKQLREKYDYLILFFSGGSDSQQILKTFLDNKIRIDEIIVTWPLGLKNTYTPNTVDYEWTNMLSEWDFVIQPKLKWLAENHPEIKITLHDWATPAINHKVQDDYIIDRSVNITPYADLKWDFNQTSWFSKIRDKNDKLGLVMGIDKPRICFHQGAYRLFFLDILTSNLGPQISSSFHNDDLKAEFFYWSPDSVNILAKQAHLLVKFFESVPQFKNFVTWPHSNPRYRQWYETSTRPIIYPELDLNFFQANKPHDFTISWDELLYKVGLEDKIKGITDDNFNYLRKVVDPKYFTTTPNGLPSITGFITGMWPVKYCNT